MKRRLIILIILYFIQGIGTNILHPVMPKYIEHLQLPKYMFGFLFAFMNLGMMLGSPFFGNLSDHGKKKQSLITGLLIYGISQVLFGLGSVFNGWTLSLIRLISGFGIAAAFTILTSEMVTISSKESRARNLGFSAAAGTLGGSIGQFIGGFLYTNSWVVQTFKTNNFLNIAIFQFSLIFLLVLIILIFFKPTPVMEKLSAKRPQFWEGFKEIRNISKNLLLFLIALVLITIAATNIDKYLDIFINDSGYEPNYIGNYKLIAGFVSIFASLIVVPLLVKFKDKINVMIFLQIFSALITIFIFRISNVGLIINLYSSFMFYTILKTSFAPLEQEHIASFASKDNVSKTMGIRQAFYASGTIIGPIFGALIYEYNSKLLFDISAGLFIVAIIFLILSKVIKENKLENETFINA